MSKSWKLTSQELELTVLSRFACDLVVHSSIARKDDLNSPSLKIDLVFKTENISVSWWRKWRLPLLWRWQHRVSHKDAAYNETTMTFVKKLHWNRRNSWRLRIANCSAPVSGTLVDLSWWRRKEGGSWQELCQVLKAVMSKKNITIFL